MTSLAKDSSTLNGRLLIKQEFSLGFSRDIDRLSRERCRLPSFDASDDLSLAGNRLVTDLSSMAACKKGGD
jgi:hypothetical protein